MDSACFFFSEAPSLELSCSLLLLPLQRCVAWDAYRAVAYRGMSTSENFEKFRLLTWLEIKPNKQVRLYAPSHEADKSEGQCGALVFRASFVFVRVRGCLLFARSCSRPSSLFRFGCFRLGCFPLFGCVFFVVSRFLVFVFWVVWCVFVSCVVACSSRLFALVLGRFRCFSSWFVVLC